MRKQLNVRIPDTTHQQIAALCANGYESQAHVIMIAVHDLYRKHQQETRTMTTDYGTVTHEGTTYTLTQQAYPSGRVFTGWWGDASEGEEYTAEYEAHAVDAKGDEYIVRWHFDAVRNEEPEDEGNWPWFDDNIVAVIPA
jgi:hypothetical protein